MGNYPVQGRPSADDWVHLCAVETALEYPLYRRSAGGRSYYHIISPTEMREIQVLGKYYMVYEVRATILPERLLITDISSLHGGAYVAISGDDFAQFERNCREGLSLYNQP